ncbi:MAG: hypothetical protein LBP63_02795 [Prevotellaceae bacterium]|jgi:hypothetical protein|nr:hypothetical protein [Prevotellaceae bacterium]
MKRIKINNKNLVLTCQLFLGRDKVYEMIDDSVMASGSEAMLKDSNSMLKASNFRLKG